MQVQHVLCVYAGRSENKIHQKLFALHLRADHDAREITLKMCKYLHSPDWQNGCWPRFVCEVPNKLVQ